MLRGTWSLLSAVLWRLPDKEREEAADVLLILGGSEQRELACARLHSGEALLILSSGAAREEDLASAARGLVQRLHVHDGRDLPGESRWAQA